MRNYNALQQNYRALDKEINPTLMKGKSTAELIKINESIEVISKQISKLKNYMARRNAFNLDNAVNSDYPAYPFY